MWGGVGVADFLVRIFTLSYKFRPLLDTRRLSNDYNKTQDKSIAVSLNLMFLQTEQELLLVWNLSFDLLERLYTRTELFKEKFVYNPGLGLVVKTLFPSPTYDLIFINKVLLFFQKSLFSGRLGD